MARQLPNAARPYTPGVGPSALPPTDSGISATNFHLPSWISHVNPFFILVLDTPVPKPSEGFSERALMLLSTLCFNLSASINYRRRDFIPHSIAKVSERSL